MIKNKEYINQKNINLKHCKVKYLMNKIKKKQIIKDIIF